MPIANLQVIVFFQSPHLRLPEELYLLHLGKFCSGSFERIYLTPQFNRLASGTLPVSVDFLLPFPRYQSIQSRGPKQKFQYDFSQLEKVDQRGQRQEQKSNTEPMAWPEFLSWYTEKAPSYQRYLLDISVSGVGVIGVTAIFVSCLFYSD